MKVGVRICNGVIEIKWGCVGMFDKYGDGFIKSGGVIGLNIILYEFRLRVKIGEKSVYLVIFMVLVRFFGLYVFIRGNIC